MTTQITCALIKPDAVQNGSIGAITNLIEKSGFTIVRMELMTLTRAQAEEFYAIHKERSFFGELVEYMTSGPIVALALQRENAVNAWRELMGATNPAEARLGTIRALYGTDVGHNATHGSDSAENAAREVSFFFSDL